MAGRIPQSFIDDLVDRSDIVEVIASRIQLKKAGREYKACCPFHGEKTPSFTVSPEKGFYHCFGCGAHGTAIGFLMEHDRLEFVEAVEELAGMQGLEVPREQSGGRSEPVSPAAPLLDLLKRAGDAYQQELKNHQPAIDYLKRRGLTGQAAATYQIGYAPAGWDYALKRFGKTDADRDNLIKCGLVLKNEENRIYDRFRDRIMFPIRDARGRIVGFGGRVMDNTEPKYLNSPETPVFHKGHELYGVYEARQANRKLETVLVVEGYMDVVALACHGITNAVATLGTATTPEHLQRLFRFAREIVFCFDGDKAGRKAAWRALQITLPELREGRQVSFLFLAEGEDPDSVVRDGGAEAFAARLRNAQPLSAYLIEHLKSETDLSSLDGQARLAELARPLIRAIPEGVFRELLLDRLAAEVGLSPARLGALLAVGIAGNSEPPEPEPPTEFMPPAGGRNTLVRKAVCLVLQQPRAAATITIPAGLTDLPNPGIALLFDLLLAAQENPDIRPARLAEEFAGHPDGGSHLQALLLQDLQLDIDDAGWAAELEQTLGTLLRQELEKRFASLMARSTALSDAEKQELRELQQELAKLHRSRT